MHTYIYIYIHKCKTYASYNYDLRGGAEAAPRGGAGREDVGDRKTIVSLIILVTYIVVRRKHNKLNKTHKQTTNDNNSKYSNTNSKSNRISNLSNYAPMKHKSETGKTGSRQKEVPCIIIEGSPCV